MIWSICRYLQGMESENGVQVEDEKKGPIRTINEEGSVTDTKENDSVNKGEEVSKESIVSGTSIEAKQSTSGTVVELTKSKSKPRNSNKLSVQSSSKSSKITKDQSNVKGSSSSLFGRKARPTLSQSLSFSSRGSRNDTMRSVDGSTIKSSARQSQTNGARSESRFSNRNVSSVKAASTVANSKEEGANSGAVNRRQTTVGSLPSQSSSSVKFYLGYLFTTHLYRITLLTFLLL